MVDTQGIEIKLLLDEEARENYIKQTKPMRIEPEPKTSAQELLDWFDQ